MNSYAPRLSISYAEFEPVAPLWAEYAQQMAVYEHEADASVRRTHIHVLILGSSVKAEQLKRIFKKTLPKYEASGGNDFWKWESKYGTPNEGFLQYMPKGILRPKYLKNFSDESVEEWRKKWVDHTPSQESSTKYDEYEELKRSYAQTHDVYIQLGGAIPITLDSVRKWTMSWYWRRDGRLPPATAYKRNAGSLFVWANEKRCGVIPDWVWEEVKNLWY